MALNDKNPAASVRPSSVLFLCGQNAIRSPLAESLARRLLPRDVFIASAGIRAGERDPFVDAVLTEAGHGRREASPRIFDPNEDGYFDLIVTLAPEAHHAALELTRTVAVEVEYWPTPDPSAVTGSRDQIMDAYRDVRERLATRIADRFGTGARKSSDE